ncbi:MAG: hypothetical protein CMD33_02645 [Flavobacteriales bacterium]|mgnify:CR=1 FL=1|jgi:hypothetical protein|nr:hypothetical protein [Flavobacteriales bacterium]|tara:strand:- start:137 stop:646 length:510 start_codon:yes stop_codon:yes gene_type:complete
MKSLIYAFVVTSSTLLLFIYMPCKRLHKNNTQHFNNAKKDVRISMASLEGNAFEIALSKEGPSETDYFIRPVVLEIAIGGERPIILSANGADTVDIIFNSLGKQVYQFDELTLPPSASSDYVMRIRQNNEGETPEIKDVEISVAVGCSDEAKDNLMECFVTCNQWSVSW